VPYQIQPVSRLDKGSHRWRHVILMISSDQAEVFLLPSLCYPRLRSRNSTLLGLNVYKASLSPNPNHALLACVGTVSGHPAHARCLYFNAGSSQSAIDSYQWGWHCRHEDTDRTTGPRPKVRATRFVLMLALISDVFPGYQQNPARLGGDREEWC
jgi:hypothetical protein